MAAISGTSGDDRIVGTPDHDLIFTLGGRDRIRGGFGNDTINSGPEGDEIAGDHGTDVIFGGAGNDVIDGGSGNDTLFGDDGHDFISGGWGSNSLFGGAGNDFLWGDGASDHLTPGTGIDTMYGGAGSDTVFLDFASTDVSVAKIYTTGILSANNAIRLKTPDGEEFFREIEYFHFTDGVFRLREVKQFRNEFIGTNGDDVLFGSDASGDVIFAWEGDDMIRLSQGSDAIGGWTGFDTIFASPGELRGLIVNLEIGEARLRGLPANNKTQLFSIEAALGGEQNDHFTDSVEDNLFNGRGGNDYFLLSYGGTDTVEGGDGVDTLYYTFAANAGDLHVSLIDERGHAGHAEDDVIRNIENLFGSFGDDTLVGDDADNLLNGYAGNNVLTGMGGDDTLIGNAYRDDIAVYSGTQDDYAIQQSTNPEYDFVVRHTATGGTDGTDHLRDIDILRFADGDLLL